MKEVNLGKRIKKLFLFHIVFLGVIVFISCSREQGNNATVKVEIPIDSKSNIYELILKEKIDFSHLIKKADSLFDVGEYVKAESLYNKAHNLSLESGNKKLIGVTLIGIGASKDRQFEYEEAIEIFNNTMEYKSLMDNPSLYLLFFNKGVSLQKTDKLEGALNSYKNAILIDSNLTEAYINLAKIYYSENQKDKAFKELSKAIDLGSKYYDAYLGRGIIYLKKEEYQKALKDLNFAIKLNPKSVKAYKARGMIYGDEGKIEKALSDFNKAIELEPKNSDLYSLKAFIFYEKESYNKALRNLNKAIELNSNSHKDYHLRGIIYGKKGKYDQAIDEFTKAINLEPQSYESYYFRGLSYANKGNYKEAITDYKKTLDLNPRFDEAQERLRELKQFK